MLIFDCLHLKLNYLFNANVSYIAWLLTVWVVNFHLLWQAIPCYLNWVGRINKGNNYFINTIINTIVPPPPYCYSIVRFLRFPSPVENLLIKVFLPNGRSFCYFIVSVSIILLHYYFSDRFFFHRISWRRLDRFSRNIRIDR